MKKLQLLVCLLAIIFCLSACGPAEDVRLQEKIFVIHDEVMPRMGELVDLQTALKAKLKTDENKIEITSCLVKLNTADSLMWKWMADYKQVDNMKAKGQSQEEILLYLNIEKNKIDRVAMSMNKSMEEAKQLLER